MKIIILMLALSVTLFSFTGCSADSSVVYELKEDANTVSSEREDDSISSAGTEEPIDGGEDLGQASYASKTDISKSDEKICVYICGEVASPGVYELDAGSRIYQLIELAGGLLEDADERTVNQAEELFDGQQITIYSKDDNIIVQEPSKIVQDGKVNINRAQKEELMTLDGIGEARAEDIIKYRNENGYFSSIDDIKNVTGIKEKMFEKIKDEITV